MEKPKNTDTTASSQGKKDKKNNKDLEKLDKVYNEMKAKNRKLKKELTES
jgi:hypothetical protein